MKPRNLLTFLAILLLVSAQAQAQRTPPAPPSPPTEMTAPVPQVFSFSFEGNGYLGVSPENITRENMSQYGLSSPRGVGISNVSPGSPAEKAGLRKGDVILQFDGEPVTSTRKLMRLIGESAPEQAIRMTISRGGSEQQLSVMLGEREPGRYSLGRAWSTTPNENFRMMEPPVAPRAPRGIAPELFSYGFGNNRRVGITTTTLTKQLADFFGVSNGQGILISSVSENSPASKAGLRAGDVVTEVNGEKIEDADDFIRALNKKEEGEVSLTIIRDKSQRTIKVTPEKRTVPAINLTEFQSVPMARNLIPLGRTMNLMNLPDVRTLQPLPRGETFVLPKIEGLPRLLNLPRGTLLQSITPVL